MVFFLSTFERQSVDMCDHIKEDTWYLKVLEGIQEGFLEKPNVPPLTKEICYKVFVYGSAAVGKTSLVKFLNNENCSDAYHETNGINITQIFHKYQERGNQILLKLQFWDVGYNTSLMYSHLLPDCLKEVDVIVCVFSFNDKSSFQALEGMILNFKKNNFRIPPQFVIVGTKSDDISHKFISQRQIRKFKATNDIPFFTILPMCQSVEDKENFIKILCGNEENPCVVNMVSVTFHAKSGSLVSLSNNNKTATRNHSQREFSNGLVISSDSLKSNQLFEVRLDKKALVTKVVGQNILKIGSLDMTKHLANLRRKIFGQIKIPTWSGSIELGVTTCDPNTLDFPPSATDLREGCWVMSGSTIVRDGRTIVEEYGDQDLDRLGENERVGVMRTNSGELFFFVNGINQGLAAANIPSPIYAIVDMYGKCAQVTILEEDNETRMLVERVNNENVMPTMPYTDNDLLKFHERTGSLIRLSRNSRTCERHRPVDEFNNGVVMTHRPLRDNELFEISVDGLVDKWSGSIEVGVTTHNPNTLEFPATMTNMRSGTIMMSGSGILVNGKGTKREYGDYNLDDLQEGDRIGLMRKLNGNLHFYINGLNQGVAATDVPSVVYGVIDLYGMTVKVSIVDSEDCSNASTPISNDELMDGRDGSGPSHQDSYENHISEDGSNKPPLLFHQTCGSHASVINNGRTAHRPNATDDFNNGVVLTNRPMRNNELFDVHLDRMVVKWAGSIEIGLTTHLPHELEFPSTMTNIRSGTWMMTGNGVMHNGTTVLDDYGHNLDRLKVGDRVGVVRKENGTVHFFVNGVDQGPAATNVPDEVHGVIDLYGQAAQATIVNHSALTSTIATSEDLRFHHLHGRNALVVKQGLTAYRPNAYGEFNDAIVISNRPLREGEMFEAIIEKMVDRWSGSIECGVTIIKPEDLDYPNTMTDIDYGTWMLSGSAIMQDGSTIKNGYRCDLDQLSVSSRIGMKRHADGSLHYYVNGNDQGVACEHIPTHVYAVIDLYGQCAQVSLVPPEMSISQSQMMDSSRFSLLLGSEVKHKFSGNHGKNISLRNNCHVATRVRGFNDGIVFGSNLLETEELFEVIIESIGRQWSGSLHIGVTTLAFGVGSSAMTLPSSTMDLCSMSNADTWLVVGSKVVVNDLTIKENYAPSLERLKVSDRIGLCRCSDGTLHLYINSQDLGVAASNVPKRIYPIVDVFGFVQSVRLTSRTISGTSPEIPPSQRGSINSALSNIDSLENELDGKEQVKVEFHDNRGRNIELLNGNVTARRIASYNQGLVFLNKPARRGHLHQVRIDKLNPRWTSSLSIGITAHHPEKMSMSVTALALKKPSWIVCSESVFYNGAKMKGRYGPNLNSLQVGHIIGLLIDHDNTLHLYVNGVDQGIAAKHIPAWCYILVDLYGQCEQVTIVGDNDCEAECSNTKEKAVFDNGVKEKSNCRIGADPIFSQNCEYHKMCMKIKQMLGLPDGYFLPDGHCCYCDTCHSIRGDPPYHKHGEPLKNYSVPFGWCRFTLRSINKKEATEKWHVAYHGTNVGAIRKILDAGTLLLPGKTMLGSHGHKEDLSEKQCFENDHIFVSPTITYSGSPYFSPKHDFIEMTKRKAVQAHLALQVYVRPGSYKTGPPRTACFSDPHFGNRDIEWYTKEKGATVLHSLLIKLDGLKES